VLPCESSGVGGQSGDVAFRACQASDESDLNRVAHARKDDGHRRSRLLGHESRWRRRSQDDIDLQTHQLVGKPRKLIEAAVSESEFDDHVLAGDVPPFPQTLLKGLDPGGRRLTRA
jgi:hypothetical protein